MISYGPSCVPGVSDMLTGFDYRAILEEARGECHVECHCSRKIGNPRQRVEAAGEASDALSREICSSWQSDERKRKRAKSAFTESLPPSHNAFSTNCLQVRQACEETYCGATCLVAHPSLKTATLSIGSDDQTP